MLLTSGQLAYVVRHAPCVLVSLDPRPSDRLVLNPLRSEGEAFRLLLYALAVIVTIIVVILVVRAIA